MVFDKYFSLLGIGEPVKLATVSLLIMYSKAICA